MDVIFALRSCFYYQCDLLAIDPRVYICTQQVGVAPYLVKCEIQAYGANMKHYDVVVLGAGSAGELVANDLAMAGKSVALVEKLRVGGECAYVSCIPSKAMLKSAQVRTLIKDAKSYGATGLDFELDSDVEAFAVAVTRRDEIAENRDDSGSAASAVNSGVSLYRGEGRFTEANILEVNGSELSWTDLVIATGSHPVIPEIDGISDVEIWTSDVALSSPERPSSVAIIGGGPVGCELSEIYSAFGVDTTLVQFGAQLINKEHPVIAEKLAENLGNHGVKILLDTNVEKLEFVTNKLTRITFSNGTHIEVERVVVATGRKPTSSGFNLEVLELELDKNGSVTVDEHCRAVGKSNIWAAGDITGIAPFTHTANYQGRIVVNNILKNESKAENFAIPRAVYANPPVVSVGASYDPKASKDIVQAQNEISNTSRSLTDSEGNGLVILVADADKGILVGASAIGPHADAWMGEIVLAIHARIPIKVLSDLVHGFPTYGEVLEKPLRELANRCK